MRVLLTGGAGFIGRHVLRALIARGHAVRVLDSLRPDIWLAPHNKTYKFEQKRARAEKEGASAWVDPEGYQEWLIDQRKEVEDAIGEPVIQRTGEASRTK